MTTYYGGGPSLYSAGAQRALVSVSATSRRIRAVSDSAGLWRRLYARRFLAHTPFARLDLHEHIPPERLAHEDRERALLACWYVYLFIYVLRGACAQAPKRKTTVAPVIFSIF